MKKLIQRVRRWWDARVIARAVAKDAQPDAPTVEPRKRRGINPLVATRAKAAEVVDWVPEPYKPLRGVVPAGATMAMDDDPGFMADYAQALYSGLGGWEGQRFPGYPYLARLQLKPEYRRMMGTLAEEMTRKWITLTTKGDDDKSERREQLIEAIKTFGVRDLFRNLSAMDSGFGRAQLYIDLGDKTPEELKTPLVLDPRKIRRGELRGFRVIEPIWTYPAAYDARNPLSPDFYRPRGWYVMGQEIHNTRLLTIVSNPVPDLLKASYNFSGVSLVQLAEGYVANWERSRDAVSDLIHNFSTSGVMTDMSAVLTEADDGGDMFKRLDLFNAMRDNKGLLVLNKDSEEFFQFNVPLSGMEKLVAQAQEQMATPAAIPLIKFFGITPSGLNATAEPELRVFYDHVHAKQEDDWREPLSCVLRVIMLHLWGEIDEDIDFEFASLWEVSPVEAAEIRKSDADTDAVYIGAAVITPDEVRERLIADEGNAYHGLESNAAALTIEEETQARQEQADAELEAPRNPKPEPANANAGSDE